MIVTSPMALRSQATEPVADHSPELRVTLEPGPAEGGVPDTFTFHLLNVGQKDLRIPEPNVDCGNATINGSVWLNESWQPARGDGLGKGMGFCDIGGTSRPSPPITKIARTWHLLKPGESLYIRAT